MVRSLTFVRDAHETGRQENAPGDEAEDDREHGGRGDVGREREFGVDRDRQHVDVGRKREGRAEGAHGGRKAERPRREERGREGRNRDVLENPPGGGAERARGLFIDGVHLAGRRHDGRDDAGNREVEVAEEEPRHAVGEDELSRAQGRGEDRGHAVSAAQHDDHEAHDDAREGKRERDESHHGAAAGEVVAFQKDPREGAERDGRDRDEKREDDGGKEARSVARIGEDFRVEQNPLVGRDRSGEKPQHGEHEEGEQNREGGKEKEEMGSFHVKVRKRRSRRLTDVRRLLSKGDQPFIAWR